MPNPLACPPVECLEVYAVNAALRYQEAEDLLRRLGPALFATDPVRRIVRASVFGMNERPPLERDRAETEAFLQDLGGCTIPDGPALAVRLIHILAELRHLLILADQLGWASDQIRHGRRVVFVRDRVADAFAIALGERPLDPAETWEVAA
jgi:hypothetical protein